MKKEKTAIFIIDILKSTIGVYFDTFFVLYFFQVANYEVLPLAKYYLTLYLFCGIGFFLIRNAMKKNNKIPYFRIGISLQAIYISAIMILKENIINYIYLIGLIKGIADGFYHFPKNIFNTEKITNEERQKYSGTVNSINKLIAVVVPIILGVVLTFISYTNLAKIFFVLFIIMFFVSFNIKDDYYVDKNSEIKKFFKLIAENKNIRYATIIPFLSGLTYSSGVMATIVTLSKINVFKTNLNLGFVDSLCAFLYLLISILFAAKIKKKNFKTLAVSSGIISCFTLIGFAFIPNTVFLIIYLIIRNSFIVIINLITANIINNLSNSDVIKNNFKSEYFLARDVMYSISRCFGYLILLGVCLIFGMQNINYILIISGISLLLETIVVGNILKKEITD